MEPRANGTSRERARGLPPLPPPQPAAAGGRVAKGQRQEYQYHVSPSSQCVVPLPSCSGNARPPSPSSWCMRRSGRRSEGLSDLDAREPLEVSDDGVAHSVSMKVLRTTTRKEGPSRPSLSDRGVAELERSHSPRLRGLAFRAVVSAVLVPLRPLTAVAPGSGGPGAHRSCDSWPQMY